MTEEIAEVGQTQEPIVEAPPPVQEAPPPVQEKMLPQSQVSKIVGREVKEAYERGRRQALQELNNPQAVQQPQPTPSPMMQDPQAIPQAAQSAPQSMGGMQQYSPDQIQRMIDEKIQQQQQAYVQKHEAKAREQWAANLVNEFNGKLQRGTDPEFDKKIDQLDLQTIPEIVQLANATDNTREVMRELADNPAKVGAIIALAQRNPQLANLEMQKLSNSIKLNQQAANANQPGEPLGRINPSATGTDSGEMSVKDFMKIFRG